MVREGIGWDPFSDSTDRYKRIRLGSSSLIFDEIVLIKSSNTDEIEIFAQDDSNRIYLGRIDALRNVSLHFTKMPWPLFTALIKQINDKL